jgi:DNA mismatch repair protein MSH5
MQIVSREREVMHAVTSFILEYSDLLLVLHRKLAQLDCLISFATVAHANNFNRPKMTEENVLYMTQARHPLLELTLDGTAPVRPASVPASIIPNDCQLAHMREGCVKVISGPNNSGKSVYLKQTALIAVMAQIGCFVPAESALIGITDFIGGRMSTPESMLDGKSAFLSDVSRVGQALRRATARSLILLDEFGTGTKDHGT